MIPRPSRTIVILGGLLVFTTGLGWALLSWRLAAGGEVPGSLRGAVGVAPEAWYRAQAAWVGPLVLALWGVMSLAAEALARRATETPGLAVTAGAVGLGWAGPLQSLLVFPELVIYEVWGMDALGAALPVVGLLTVLGCWLGTSLALTLVRGLPAGRARLVAALVLLLGAVLGSPFLR